MIRRWLAILFPSRRRNFYSVTVLSIIAVGVVAAGVAKLAAVLL
jgi:hypothetical protein